MFNVNNKYTRTGIFNVNFEYILHLVLVSLLLTLSRKMPDGFALSDVQLYNPLQSMASCSKPVYQLQNRTTFQRCGDDLNFLHGTEKYQN